ncbi:MAG TPA: CocE/NonD family hydrolase, partial [Candidatus Angelobacter sp.]|nr:CocE/NonD family hydrolase [Candidatus Angelobacter sp.]
MKRLLIAVLLLASFASAQSPKAKPAATPKAAAAAPSPSPATAKSPYANYPSETPADFKPAMATWDYERREAEIPMRDGIKLHTVILVPRSATKSAQAPILLTRTPYSADELTSHDSSPHLGPILAGYDNAVEPIVEGGYIRVVQDVRGKYGSEGDYVMNRPLHGPLNPTPVDHSTDTWDTIDWLVKNIPESNGRVGILGISYDGFLPLMALVNPHPALKVSVPMNPMVDGWRGDDWFHNGAFRQQNLPYIYEQTATRKNDAKWWSGFFDDYDLYMSAGSAGELARIHGMDQLGFWKKVTEHPAYDSFWQNQAMDKILAAQPLKVPVMLVDSLWDQEDIYGAMAVYKAIKPKDTDNSKVFLVIGPWHHGQEIGDGRTLGALRFDGDTALYFRQNILRPFLDRYLKDGATANAAAASTSSPGDLGAATSAVSQGNGAMLTGPAAGVGLAPSGNGMSSSTPQPSGEGAPGAKQVISGSAAGLSPNAAENRPSGTGTRMQEVAPVNAYETGTNTWRRLPSWPPTDNGACAVPCVPKPTPLYLHA